MITKLEMITPAPEVSCFYSHVYLPTLYKVHERVTEVTKQIFLFIILRFYEVFHGYLLVSTFNIHPSIYPSICLYHSIHLYRSVDLFKVLGHFKTIHRLRYFLYIWIFPRYMDIS